MRSAMTKVTELMCTPHGWNVKTFPEVACYWTLSLVRCAFNCPTSPGLFMQAIIEVAQLICTWHLRCVQAFSNASCIWLMLLGQWKKSRTEIAKSMCTHTTDACRPCVLLPPKGSCLMADSHMRNNILLCQCAHTTADSPQIYVRKTQLMCTSFEWGFM